MTVFDSVDLYDEITELEYPDDTKVIVNYLDNPLEIILEELPFVSFSLIGCNAMLDEWFVEEVDSSYVITINLIPKK